MKPNHRVEGITFVLYGEHPTLNEEENVSNLKNSLDLLGSLALTLIGENADNLGRNEAIKKIANEFLNNSELDKTLSGTTDDIVQNFISAYNELKSYVEGKANEPA